MPTPLMVTTGTTATGDIITGTCAKILVKGMPVATITSPVSGATCVGVISSTSAVKLLFMGLPAANITSPVVGAHPITGIPITVPAMMSNAINIIC
ncbi:MAG: hypothetical protein RR607_00395 [Akkermansia sp.]